MWMKEVHVIVLFLSHMEACISQNGIKGVMNYIMNIFAFIAMNVT
jgi:hypothetical protein